MPAPKGNQFWKLRSKHGRDKLFDNPDLLWEAACEYFEWCDEHPWKRVETTNRGKSKEVKTIPTQRPYTKEGLCLYCGATTAWWSAFKNAGHKGFSEVIMRIEDVIYKQKFEGASVGAFNATIIARDLGLRDKTEMDLSASHKLSIENMTDDELDEEISKLGADLKIIE